MFNFHNNNLTLIKMYNFIYNNLYRLTKCNKINRVIKCHHLLLKLNFEETNYFLLEFKIYQKKILFSLYNNLINFFRKNNNNYQLL